MPERTLRQKDRRLLYYWFWAWPLIGMTVLSIHWIDSNTFRNCVQALFVPGLIGTVSSGWTIIRTNDIRYSLQLVASAIVFAVGFYQYWHVTQ